jgi:hypothetical protein
MSDHLPVARRWLIAGFPANRVLIRPQSMPPSSVLMPTAPIPRRRSLAAFIVTGGACQQLSRWTWIEDGNGRRIWREKSRRTNAAAGSPDFRRRECRASGHWLAVRRARPSGQGRTGRDREPQSGRDGPDQPTPTPRPAPGAARFAARSEPARSAGNAGQRICWGHDPRAPWTNLVTPFGRRECPSAARIDRLPTRHNRRRGRREDLAGQGGPGQPGHRRKHRPSASPSRRTSATIAASQHRTPFRAPAFAAIRWVSMLLFSP